MNMRNKTLRSFYSPAPTPVIPPRQPSVEVQPESETIVKPQEQEVATGVSNVNVGADNVETERGSNDPNVALNDVDSAIMIL
jgi:hypothetical protein